jgi:hypothetical protein
MAKIPRALDIAGDAQQTRGVVDVPVVGAGSTAEGWREVQRAFSAMGDVADRLHKADVDRKITTADRKTREELDREFRSLEQSGDIKPEEFETRYREASDKIIGANAEMVPQGGRAMWTERAKTQWQSDGIIRTRDLTRRRQLADTRAGIVAESAHLKDMVGDTSIDANTYAGMIQGQRNLVDRQVQNGVLEKDDAARLLVELDDMVVEDRLARASVSIEELVLAGDAKAADDVIAEAATTAAQKKALKQVKESTEAEQRAQIARAEAERNKAQLLASNRMEIGILDGEITRRQINEAAADGTISENHAPVLIRALRAEQERREREAKMSDAYKAEWADASLDALQKLSTMPNQFWMQDPEEWKTTVPQAYEAYQNMDRDRRRAVRQKHLDSVEKGQTQDTAMGAYRDLVVRAQRLVPEDWKLSTSTVAGEGDGFEFSGQLYGLAKRYALENGDKAIPEKDAREIVSRALHAFKPKTSGFMGMGAGGYGLPADLMLKDMLSRQGIDPDLAMEVRNRLTQRLGREPTQEELMSSYRAVEGAQ